MKDPVARTGEHTAGAARAAARTVAVGASEEGAWTCSSNTAPGRRGLENHQQAHQMAQALLLPAGARVDQTQHAQES